MYYINEANIAICNDGYLYKIENNSLVLYKYNIDEKGYVRYTKLYIDKKIPTSLGHRIVALNTISVPEKYNDIPVDKLQINHKDGNKQNNKPENLEWCTSKENTQHAIVTGLDHRQNIRDERIDKIILDRQNKRMSINRLSDEYNMSPNSILVLLKENDAYEPLNNSNNPIVKQVQDLRREEHMTIHEIAEFLNLNSTSVFLYLKEDEDYASMSTVNKFKDNQDIFNEVVRLYKKKRKVGLRNI